uniref:Uncharacterized protein n=1 Tax=Sphaerodactylus townsendi TaxID=933632 RepID=A0ACB8FA40_9SAUR
MGEIEGTYRVLQTPGSRLGVQKNTGVSTLEPGQNFSTAVSSMPSKSHDRSVQLKIKLLDNTEEIFDIEEWTPDRLTYLGANGRPGWPGYAPGLLSQHASEPDNRDSSDRSKCLGQNLLTEVYKHLNLVETDYFGIEFQNMQSCWIWLEPMKPTIKQIRRPKNAMIRLAVKFFPPDPGQLQEEYTRYLFALQIKRDLVEERLTCNDNTATLLISHLLQC